MVSLCVEPSVYTLLDEADYYKIMFCNVQLLGEYVIVYTKKKYHLLHRFLMNPKEENEIDHIDRNPLNNQRYNLREVTRSENMMNQGLRSNNTTGYKGVYFSKNKKKFCADIRIKGKTYYIGSFDLAIDAARAYDSWAKELFGDNANLNFPEIISG